MVREILQKPLTRRSVFAASITGLVANSYLAKAFGLDPGLSNIILGRPTDSSIAISVLSAEAQSVYVEYGTSKTALVKKSATIALAAGMPQVIEINGLKANTKNYYRLRYKKANEPSFTTGKTNSFSTAKTSGKSFSFSVQGDTHPERAGKMFNADLYLSLIHI